MSRAVLELDSITKTFGDVVAVDSLTETIGDGEYFCILGPSGCGKTTLLRMIAGFEEPTAGRMMLDGAPLIGVPPEKRPINIVFQSYALFPHMSVFENVAFGLRARREPDAVVQARVRESLALVRLEREGQRLPRQLSGGQQQRVALARALVMQPRVLLLDEPLSALDRHLRLAMQEELRRVHAQTGLTFIHITHDQSEALALGQRVAVMRAGRFAQVATPQQLYSRPTDRFVAEFVGTSNVFDAVVVGPREIQVGDVVLPTTAPIDGTRVVVSVRPEAVHIHASAASGFTATLVSCAFAGAVFTLTFKREEHVWVAHVPARAANGSYQVGAEFLLSIDPSDVVVVSA